ncbi:MAG: hypothetical protein JXA97_01765 [Anaerolineales bacterium]|nr:hypothetical protein [Anaerolineales bacterium]
MKRFCHVAVLLPAALMLSGCAPAPAASTPTAALPPEPSFTIQVELDQGEAALEVLGPPFTLRNDNCGGETDSTEIFAHERSFQVEISLSISEEVRGAVGGGIPGALQANLEAGLETQIGIRNGSVETATVERHITIPPNSIVETTLQWQEVWTVGSIHLLNAEGELLWDVPFDVMSTLHLAQLGVETERCSPTPAPSPDIDPHPFAFDTDIPAALDCLGAHLLNPAVPALCPVHWINTGANSENLAGYILDRQIAPVFTALDSAEWVPLAANGFEFDEAWSTPQAAVYTLQLETVLNLTGDLHCASGAAAVYGAYAIPLSGQLRAEVLYPGSPHETLRIYSWVIEEFPLRALCPLGDGG